MKPPPMKRKNKANPLVQLRKHNKVGDFDHFPASKKEDLEKPFRLIDVPPPTAVPKRSILANRHQNPEVHHDQHHHHDFHDTLGATSTKETDLVVLLPPKDRKISFHQSHETKEISPLVSKRESIGMGKPSIGSSASIGLEDDNNTSAIKSFLQAFGFQKTVKKAKKAFAKAKHYDEVTYEIHLIGLPLWVQILSTLAPIWEWCMYVMGLASFFIITVLSVFSFYVEELYDIVYYVDVIFGVDTCLRALVEVWRFHSKIPCIVFITPYTLLQFTADICSIIPLERIYVQIVGIDDVDFLKYFDFLRYNRFIRTKRLFSFLTAALKEQRISERPQFFVWYFTSIVFFIQGVACIFYFFLKPDPIDFILKRNLAQLAGSWIGPLSDKKPGYQDTFYHHYILSLSFSTAVVTTVGYGDIVPTSTLEMIIAIFAMLIGAIFLTGLFSSGLTSFELEHDGARFDLFFRVDALMKQLVDIKTTPYYRARVLEYYNLLWLYREGVYSVQLFEQLPKTMKEEIMYDMCQEMFHKSALFRGLEESFLRALSRIVKPVLYNPEMILCTKGKYAMQMVYIIQGEVLVRSKYRSDKVAAILRPGCIFGEINLFFSYPYTTNVETKTCCQLLVIEKESLFDLLAVHQTTLELLRGRVQERLRHLHEYYKVVGEVPLYWIEFSAFHNEGDMNNPRNVFPVSFRKGSGLNTPISHDILDDGRDVIIVEMPCMNKKFEKTHTTVYKSSVVPNILISEHQWLKWWHISIMFLGMYGAFLSPYCLVFKATSQIENTICQIDAKVIEWVVSIIFIADVFVEICNAVPTSGYYYKFKDGINLKVSEITFWMDVFAAMPFNLIGTQLSYMEGGGELEIVKIVSISGTTLRCLKLWKVLRYFNYLDNKYYNRLFTCRIVQTMVVLVYFTHFLACIIFMIACPSSSRFETPQCKEDSWLRSYEVASPDDENVKYKKLSVEMPYLLSFYFAAATLSSAGFGDFNPQNADEIIFLLLFELISFTIIGYYTAILTSALSCTIRPQLVFQQKLLGIKQFMEHQGISEDLQHRVVEHYHLQNLLWSGVTLPDKMYHFMYDTPDYLRDDSLILEVDLHFEGVPLLTKVEPKVIVKIAELIRRYLIPPNSIFLRKGEVRRQMYIIGKGSVGILSSKTQQPERILEATSHFGIRDLLFGEPAHNHIKTLSYCLLYEIEYHDLDDLFNKESEGLMKNILKEEREIVQPDIDLMTKQYARVKTSIREKRKTIESWNIFPWWPTQNPQLFCCTFFEYKEVFRRVTHRWVFWILLHKTIHPAGLFAKIWVTIISFVSCISLVFLLFESYTGKRDPDFRMLQFICDLINYLDVYIKLHWSFYNKKNVLICHPVRTALHYIYEGSFFYDVFFTAPFEVVAAMITGTHILGYSKGVYWFSKIRWTRFGQVLRIPAVVSVCNKIFTMRNETLVLLYFMLTIVLCTSTSCIALNIACPIGAKIWEEGDQYKLPYCLGNSWASQNIQQNLIGLSSRLLYGIYYTSNVIFAIGFGDLITLRRSELILLIVMMVFGFMVDVCILANITAAEVDIDENRAKYLQSMECIEYILYKEKVSKSLRKVVRAHLQHTWIMSQGLQPKQLFVDLHPALESDLFREYVGELLKRVPIFSGLPENIVRTLCQYMNKHYFLKGEAMMRSGNLEPEMYVIVSGKVWITDRSNKWICTLRSSETFGETSMLYGAQRKYSAFAGSAVEAFCLTGKDYEEVLERYPVVKHELEKKVPGEPASLQQDLFELKVKKVAGIRDIGKSPSNLTTDTLNRTTTPRANKINSYIQAKMLTDPGEHRTTKSLDGENVLTRVIIGSGTDDENLPIIYFAKRYTNESFKFLFHPECTFMRFLSFLVVLLSFFTPMVSTYEMSFTGFDKELDSDEETFLFHFHVVSETIMYLHICLQFLTPFRIGETSQYCKEYRKIAQNYLMSPTRFLFDFVAIFPIPFIQKLTDRTKYWHLLRVFRLVHFYKALVDKKDDLGKGIFFYKISVSLSTFLLIIHGVSCFVYEISPCYCSKDSLDKCIPICAEGTWTHALSAKQNYGSFEKMRPHKWYIRSFYWVTSTVSTTGFGDIVPKKDSEIIIATLCTFVGAFVLAIILSQFTSGISSRTKAHREFLYQVNLLSKHLGNIGTSQSRLDEVRTYFVTLWEESRGVPYHEAITILPYSLQIEVNFFLYYLVVRQSKLFYNLEEDRIFFRQVCIRLKHTLLLPGSVIVNQGDQGDCLYIVFKGVVTGYRNENDDGIPVITRQYHPGNAFGKYPALFYDQSYNKSYRTETNTEVLSLSQEDLIELKSNFPQFAEKLEFQIIRKYEPRENQENIFQKRIKKKGLLSMTSDVMEVGLAAQPSIWEETRVKLAQEMELSMSEKEKALAAAKSSSSSITTGTETGDKSLQTEPSKYRSKRKLRKRKSNPRNKKSEKLKNQEIAPTNKSKLPSQTTSTKTTKSVKKKRKRKPKTKDN